MNNQIISKDKPYQTRDGRKVVILADNVPDNKYPVVGYVVEDGETHHYQWTKRGYFHAAAWPLADADLIPVPVVIVEYSPVWDNTHDDDSGIHGWSQARAVVLGGQFFGFMVRTTEEGKPPVYHFEPI